MTHGDEPKISKTRDTVKVGYQLFTEKEKKKLTLSENDKNELLHFISMNMDALSKKDSIEKIDKINPNLDIELHTPKLPTAPFQRGYLTYTYIIKQSANGGGLYGEFTSSLNRKDDDAPWSYSSMSTDFTGDSAAVIKFNRNDYKELNVEFRRKFLMSDVESKAITPELSPDRKLEQFVSENTGVEAFYQFSTVRNGTPLTLVLGVSKKDYNKEEEYPANWFTLYIKRDDAPAFSLPGE